MNVTLHSLLLNYTSVKVMDANGLTLIESANFTFNEELNHIVSMLGWNYLFHDQWMRNDLMQFCIWDIFSLKK